MNPGTLLRTESGEPISRLGLGCSRIGSLGNTTGSREVRATLNRALERGINVFDTADIYGQGDSEREIGRCLASRRSDAFVMTKVGQLFSGGMGWLRPLKPLIKPILAGLPGARGSVTRRRAGVIKTDFAPARLARALDASLRRLRFERVDALFLHSPTAAQLRQPGLGEALAGLKQAGKVRHYGISCDDMLALAAALDIPGVELLQLPLDVLDAATLGSARDTISRRGIAVFAREVIVARPSLAPPQAVAQAAMRPDVTAVIFGTNHVAHLDAAADSYEAAMPR